MDVIEAAQLSRPQALGHWYYDAKFQLLKYHLGQIPWLDKESRLVDIGCGLGVVMTMLEQDQIFYPGSMIGIDPAYQSPALALGGNAQILPQWPEAHSYDMALLMDVLEHVPDDLALLREVSSHLNSGARLFITVPAFSWLWSAHDRFLGHYRRYNMKTLSRVIAKAGSLRNLTMHYFYASVLPVAAPWRLARRAETAANCSDLTTVAPWINKALLFASALELKFAKWNRFAGLSVVATCEKV